MKITWEKAEELRSDFLYKVVKPLLPNAKYKFTLQHGDYTNTSNNFSGVISDDDIFNGSIYGYTGKNKFIHFTTLQSLEAILLSGFIRMSDFTSLTDRSELEYASSVLNDYLTRNGEKERIENEKKSLFCLSFCESTQNTIRDTFMWNEYGAKGSGVIIDFSISEFNANRFSIGKIRYGSDALKDIIDLKNRALEFLKETNFYHASLVNLLAIVLSYHKSVKYKNEKELRLLFNDKELNFSAPKNRYYTMDSAISNRNEIYNYNKIFLKGRDCLVSSNPRLFPEIKINRVILGYNLSLEQKEEVISHLNSLKNKLGNLNFKISCLNNDLELLDKR